MFVVMKYYFIYGLQRNGVIFYVGFTANLNRRFVEHQKNFGENIELVKLDEVRGSRLDAEVAEQKHIYSLGLLGKVLSNKNVSTTQSVCDECGNEILQISGKRAKKFCDSTCRSNFWQKKQRIMKKVAENNKPENKKRILEERNTVSVKNFNQPEPPSNFSIDTRPKNLMELKAICPHKEGTDERRVWIAEERQKYSI